MTSTLKKDHPKEETKRTDKDSFRKIQTFNSEAIDECCFSDDEELGELN